VREVLTGDPLAILSRWVTESGQPTMTLATADADGTPHARTVLVTAIGARGITFHTSSPTGKTRDLAARPAASGVFHWPGRQVVVAGTAAEAPVAESRAAFPTRPLGLRRLAWAYATLGTRRSAGGGERTPGTDRPHIDGEGAPGTGRPLVEGEVEAAFAAAGDASEMPPGWTTIVLAPHRLDFWQAGSDDVPASKTRFTRTPEGWKHGPALP
jgi:pyridoxamine 5'-phosphate oxidase